MPCARSFAAGSFSAGHPRHCRGRRADVRHAAALARVARVGAELLDAFGFDVRVVARKAYLSRGCRSSRARRPEHSPPCRKCRRCRPDRRGQVGADPSGPTVALFAVSARPPSHLDRRRRSRTSPVAKRTPLDVVVRPSVGGAHKAGPGRPSKLRGPRHAPILPPVTVRMPASRLPVRRSGAVDDGVAIRGARDRRASGRQERPI